MMKPPMLNGEQAAPVLERLVFKVAQGIAEEPGARFLDSLVRSLAFALSADFVFAGSFRAGTKRIGTVAFFDDAVPGEPGKSLPLEFDVEETPFRDVAAQSGGSFSCPVSASERFPNDPLLRHTPGESYVGVPLVDTAGNLVGLLSAITRERLEDPQVAEDVMSVFAAFAGQELERANYTESLERQTAELRRSMDARGEDEAPGKSHLERDNAGLRDEIRNLYPAALGDSPEFRALMSHVRRVAGTSAIVLIQGEPGSGKELAARAIHNLSARRNRLLVKLDCGAMPADALEVELFGGLRPGQSDAAPRIGRLEFADNGTLLIDEVAALPLDLQAKLLRVIQQREFRPLGFQRTIKVDLRLVVTTSQDLDRAVETGRFRADLHQRLLGDVLRVPPLRRRRQDIPLLSDHFLSILKIRLGREDLSVSPRMMSQMMNYSWPGNIRELQDLLSRAALAASPQGELDLSVQTEPGGPEPVTLEEADRHHVNRTLVACNWVIEGPRGAAAALDVPPSTLRSLMKRLQIHRISRAAS